MSDASDHPSQEGEQPVEAEPEFVFEEERFPLSGEMIASGLSSIQKTAGNKPSKFRTFSLLDGSAYAFTVLNLEGKGVQDLDDSLRAYKHLRQINLSNNDILDVNDVQMLPYLVSLQASGNKVKSINFLYEAAMALQYLQVYSPNKIFNFTCVDD